MSSVSESSQRLTYLVDRRNLLADVGPGWNRFAHANEAPDLTRDRVLGRDLFSYITDDVTRRSWTALMDGVRRGEEAIEVLFRCDAPTRRRFMRMRLSAEPDGAVRFDSETLIEEVRPSIWILESAAPRHDDEVRVCSWCNRLEIEGEWFEVEDAVERLESFGVVDQPRLTHGCCEACRARVRVA